MEEGVIQKLRKGEKVLCSACGKHYYDVSSPNREYSNYFHCEDPDCKGCVHIQKAIKVVFDKPPTP